MTYEVFTSGGGAYLTTIFNAVAAIGASSAFANLMMVMAAFSVIWLMFQTAFGGNWSVNIKWFVMFTVLYLALFTPQVKVKITDSLNPALKNALIDHVPFGLAFFASATSEVGETLTRLMEQTFSLPDDLHYQKNGMLFGARLMEESSRWRITDATYAGNMSRMMRQCVFYGILLGHMNLNDLKKTDDLWQFITRNAASPLRAFDYHTRAGGRITRQILTCQKGIPKLNASWPSELSQAARVFGKTLFPGVPEAQAKALFLSRLPTAHQYLIGASRNAAAIMRQQMMINALDDGMRDWLSTLGNNAALNSYMKARADLQTRAVYRTTGLQAEKWVPLLRIVFECLYYGAFPLAFIMMLTPFGLLVVKGYFSGFLWLQSWGPLYAILHFIVMREVAGEAQSLLTGDDISVVSQLGVRSIIQDASSMAGYLSMSVPFISFGLMFGAMKFASLATSMLAPTQRAAGTAAEEGTSGNISLANTSQDVHGFNKTSGHQIMTSAMIDHGHVTMTTPEGGKVFTAANGETAYHVGQSLSSPGWQASMGSLVRTGLDQRMGEQQSLAKTQADSFRTSATAATGRTMDFLEAVSASTALNTSEGTSFQSRVSEAGNTIRLAADKLSEATGMTTEQSMSVMGHVGAGKNWFAGLEGKYGVSGVSKETWDKALELSDQYQVQESFETIRQASQEHQFNEGQSHLKDLRDSMSSSWSEAQAQETALSETLNRIRSYEEWQSRYKEDSGSFNANLTQRALKIGARDLGGTVWTAAQAAKDNPLLSQAWSQKAFSQFLDQRTPENTLPHTPGGALGDRSHLQAYDQTGRQGLRERAGALSSSASLEEKRAALMQQQNALRQDVAASRIRIDNQARGTPGERERIADRADDPVFEGAWEAAKDNLPDWARKLWD